MSKLDINYLLVCKGDEGATASSIEKYIKENFPDKVEAVADLSVAIKHAIQRGVNNGRFLKEGRYVKLSDRYRATVTERSTNKEPRSSLQREISKEREKEKEKV